MCPTGDRRMVGRAFQWKLFLDMGRLEFIKRLSFRRWIENCCKDDSENRNHTHKEVICYHWPRRTKPSQSGSMIFNPNPPQLMFTIDMIMILSTFRECFSLFIPECLHISDHIFSHKTKARFEFQTFNIMNRLCCKRMFTHKDIIPFDNTTLLCIRRGCKTAKLCDPNQLSEWVWMQSIKNTTE